MSHAAPVTDNDIKSGPSLLFTGIDGTMWVTTWGGARPCDSSRLKDGFPVLSEIAQLKRELDKGPSLPLEAYVAKVRRLNSLLVCRPEGLDDCSLNRGQR